MPTTTRTFVRKPDPEVPGTWLLTYDGDLLIGFAEVIYYRGEAWIASLGVHPKHRRHGIGTALLETVLTDHEGHRVALSAEAYTPDIENWPWVKGPSASLLAAWYGRHGFQPDPDEDSPHRMVRHP